ncbi:bifunctional proline dehydrogenase/L-glutamate gamma-semialdehyde dehydrogenase PutA [Gammaproteobacteria bacterium]|nr:bifunctional proline dehydrogenase/L-glutamate gamma-semialdehyde dehydrogenase PutA [Gammaproteobacteria bacterium]
MSMYKRKFIPESIIVPKLIQETEFLNDPSISNNAKKIIDACRENKSERTKLDAFLSEYGLDNQEGVALMCLAESILRIPDSKTRDLIISERLSEGRWIEHLNKADSLFVNASTWGLLLAGKVVKTPSEWTQNPNKFLRSIISKSGEFPIRNGVIAAMHILSQEFVMGRDFKDINKIPDINESIYSFDMLGEAARNQKQSDIYYSAYENAIEEVGKINLIKNTNNGVSIKISALCPSYEMRKYEDIKLTLIPKLISLTELGISKEVEITIDAEEQDRLSISLEIIKIMAQSQKIKDWPGFGMALQAYGKRSMDSINWLEKVLKTRSSMHLRLVKGAYWDYEIKNSQVLSHIDYSVFTKKSITDLSYLACAKRIFEIDSIYPKFATHNAHTVSAINYLGKDKKYEFQRLFGMGELLYKCANKVIGNTNKTSIYAPIGKYKDLLPYLVRRLLENGANSSFINRLLDPETDSSWLASGPHLKIENEKKDIPLPQNIFINRNNSKGIDISEMENLELINNRIKEHKNKSIHAKSIYSNRLSEGTSKHVILSIADNSEIGSVTFDDITNLQDCLNSDSRSDWKNISVKERARILKDISNEIESDPYEIIYYLMHEAGKTIQNSIDEIREAVDFLRYYSNQMVNIEENEGELEGPTGELNTLSYSAKGHFLCISPWNFPVAILIGQISAALVTGNKVTVKPSEHTSILGYIVVKKFHDNGVPLSALELVLGDGKYGDALSKVNNLSGVAFTGSLPTAKKIQNNLNQNQKEILSLIAETGGINAMIVDSSALLEQATDDIVRSAFDSSGQRCSALRVLCIQDEIYDDLLEMIKGNMQELKIGNPENLDTDIGPIINLTSKRKLNEYIEDNIKKGFNVYQSQPITMERFVSPTIIEINKLHDLSEEQFGPILHIIKFKSSEVSDLISDINNSGYGLTMGIHSRIESRADLFSQECNVGNIYINRDMVGAVVGSQPFGGRGLSGNGCKAGGPNYLKQFLNEKVVSKNSVAFGGNAELLNIQEE